MLDRKIKLSERSKKTSPWFDAQANPYIYSWRMSATD